MSKFSQKNFIKSFGYAIHGLQLAIKSQRNFIRQLCFACISILMALLLHFKILEFCILFILIANVLIAEMFNSAIEFTIDAIFKNRFSKLAGMAKDIAAGAVCIASFVSIMCGALLFFNKLFPFIKGLI